MDTSYAQVLADFDLAAMRERLNAACVGAQLDLAETQSIQRMVERLAFVADRQRAVFDPVTGDLRPIPGFSELAAYKHGPRLWYITDRTDPTREPWKTTIGSWHTSYGAACQYAILWYSRAYN